MKGDYRVCQVCLGYVRRARPLLHMSSSTPTPSTRPPPRPSSQADGGSAFGSSGVTNYFFGFLFLFAVILLILIGCGIGTRRRLLSRRANPLASLEPWASPDLKGEIAPPEFHESRFVAAPAAGWKNVMVGCNLTWLCGVLILYSLCLQRISLTNSIRTKSPRPTMSDSGIHQSLRRPPTNP